MIRTTTILSALMFAISGAYLYQSKHHSQVVVRDIIKTMHAVEDANTRVVLLRADYALLKDPQRLQQLATQYLPVLQQTAPSQYVSMADLDRRLPPVGVAPMAPPPIEPDAPDAHLPTPAPDTAPLGVPAASTPVASIAPTTDTPRSADAAQAAEPMPAPPPIPPLALAMANIPAPRAPLRSAPPHAAPARDPAAHHAPAPSILAQSAPGRAPSRQVEQVALVTRATTPAPVLPASISPASAYRSAPGSRPAPASRPAPPPPPRPMTASVLGMARTMVQTAYHPGWPVSSEPGGGRR